MNDKKTIGKLQSLHSAYSKTLANKIADIEKQWQKINIAFNKQELQNFYIRVHSLYGSSSTYGFISLSKALRDLEIYLKQLLDYRELSPTHKSELSHLVELIKDNTNTEQVLPGSLESFNKITLSNFIVYLLNEKKPYKQKLQLELNQLGYQCQLLETMDEFEAFIVEELPCAIIIDESYLDHPKIDTLSNFRQQYQVPFVCISKTNEMSIRLKTIRAGVSIFFSEPIEATYIAKQLDKICGFSTKEEYRIFILDDSESLVDYYALVLQEAGMTVRTSTNPMRLMQELQEFNPNLLLLDLYMPGCTGFELATLVRQEERYAGLPIIFISTEEDRFKQLAILNKCGGDDFLTKPVLPQNLIAAVKSRAQRSAMLSAYIIHDHLTHLLNHTYIIKQLEIELAKVKHDQKPLSLAMIDLDNFKKINDTYGHPVGDLVLKKVSDYLSDRVRETDFLGRYGGEEFAIIFPGVCIANAIKISEGICEKFSRLTFEINGHQIQTSLSVGVADYPSYKTVEHLIEAADKALYQAKSKGRNRVEYLSKIAKQ